MSGSRPFSRTILHQYRYELLTPGSMKTTLVFPIRDTPTDNMTLRLKCKHLRGHSTITSRYFSAKLTSLPLCHTLSRLADPPIIMSQPMTPPPSSSQGGRFPNFGLKISPLIATIFSGFSGNETSKLGGLGGRVVTYFKRL